MTRDSQTKVLACITHWENRIPWPYLDNADEPNVTIGIGCLVASADDMRNLPMRRVRDGRLAFPDDIGTEFLRLRSMPGGLRAAAYRGSLYLEEPDIDALAFKAMAELLEALPSVFPAWPDLPFPAQVCLLDLGWNVGTGKRPGLQGWIHLRESLDACPPNWAKAGENCTTANPHNLPMRAARNGWRVECMGAAAEGRPLPVPL